MTIDWRNCEWSNPEVYYKERIAFLSDQIFELEQENLQLLQAIAKLEEKIQEQNGQRSPKL